MDTQRLSFLLERFRLDALTPEEQAELERAIADKNDGSVLEAMEELVAQSALAPVSEDRSQADTSFAKIVAVDKRPAVVTEQPVQAKRVAFTWWAAASVILLLGAAAYFMYVRKPADRAEIVQKADPADIKAPTGNRATITLAGGNIVYLDSVNNGTIASQQNINVIKTEDGKLVYQSAKLTAQGAQLLYNTLTNPRGSRPIDMTLSDGSRVWLNAGSSLTYPVAFLGNERKVTITGEAYFEVTHDLSKPFIVSREHMEVTVLGTHFNVNAYDDEADVKITLLEGSVRVANGTDSKTIRPGGQAQVKDEIKIANDVDLDRVMAWKNGYFNFEGAGLAETMRQLERWYDIKVQYANGIPDIHFEGRMSKDIDLAGLLRILKDSEVKFRMEEGRTLVVYK